MSPLRYIRRAEVLDRLGVSNSTLCNRINEGTFVPPVKLGGRAAGWIEHEVDKVLTTLASGITRAELERLIKELVWSRKGDPIAGPLKENQPVSGRRVLISRANP